MFGGGGVQDADDLVLYEAQPLRTMPAVAIPEQHGLRLGARRDQLRLQQLRHRRAEGVFTARMLLGERIDRRGDPRGLETVVTLGAGLCHGTIHDLFRIKERGSAVTGHSRVTVTLCWIRPALGKAVLMQRLGRYGFSG